LDELLDELLSRERAAGDEVEQEGILGRVMLVVLLPLTSGFRVVGFLVIPTTLTPPYSRPG
jgi:hypothetical protein